MKRLVCFSLEQLKRLSEAQSYTVLPERTYIHGLGFGGFQRIPSTVTPLADIMGVIVGGGFLLMGVVLLIGSISALLK